MNKYLTILKFEVTHTYYANGLCPDFSFSPSPQTEKLIKGHRLQVKYQPAGFELHAPLGADNKLLIPLEKGIEFRWLLKPKTNSFYNFTALPQRDANGQYRISSQKGVVINGAKLS